MYYVKCSNAESIEDEVLRTFDKTEDARRFVERFENLHPECRARHSIDKIHVWIENEKGHHVY